MAKFVIECPACGRYAEAKTGFFARKKIECSCGNIINVRTDKMASRVCPHCGNTVVYDQSKGEKAKCPVCGEPINTLSEQTKAVEFSCKQCGVRLLTAKSAATYTCPVCDFVNDVAERVKSEEIRRDGLASIIKYEGDNETLVWKHPIEDFNLGSQLIVHESQEAIFFKDGQALDLFGAGRYTLETQQLPMLEKLYKLPTDTEGTFHSEVYYINMATIMGIKWGTDSKVRMFDPASGMHIELGASGEFNIRVADSRKLLLKIVGTAGGFGQNDLFGGFSHNTWNCKCGNKDIAGDVCDVCGEKRPAASDEHKNRYSKGFFRSMIITQVKSYLAQTIRENAINILAIDEHLMTLSTALQEKINAYLESYGLTMPEFFVSRIITPDDDKQFKQMKELYARQYLDIREQEIGRKVAEAAQQRKRVEAETAAQMKVIGAKGEAEALKVQKQAEADAYRMQAEAEAMEMKMKGYTYQQETARKVGMEAMQGGIAGGGSGTGALGDIAGLGVALGAMGGVIGMTKEAINPVIEGSKAIGEGAAAPLNPDTWDCECGNKNIIGGFCNMCGRKRPEPANPDTWDCECGNKGIIGNFCNMCGRKRPEPVKPDTWDCECGNKGIIGNFCNMCGKKRPEPAKPDTWDCECGNKGIIGNFCPNCGKKRGE